MTQEEEKAALVHLIRHGYTVVVCNPLADRFPLRWMVYRPTNRLEGHLATMNDDGTVKHVTMHE
jgi:hypothetical protein